MARVLAAVVVIAMIVTMVSGVVPPIRKWVAPICVPILFAAGAWIIVKRFFQSDEETSHGRQTSTPLCTLSIAGEAILFADSQTAGGGVRLGFPAAEWLIEILAEQFEDHEELHGVSLTSPMSTARLQVPDMSEHEIVVDSGELWILDSAFSPPPDRRPHQSSSSGGVEILHDDRGQERGLLVFPPDGDGAYRLSVVRDGDNVRMVIMFRP